MDVILTCVEYNPIVMITGTCIASLAVGSLGILLLVEKYGNPEQSRYAKRLVSEIKKDVIMVFMFAAEGVDWTWRKITKKDKERWL